MKRILFILAELCLVLAFASAVRAQNHVQTITVTNPPTTITADGNYNQVLIRENAASPSAAFSITLAGTSTALNYPAGTQFLFTGNFSNGMAMVNPMLCSQISTILARRAIGGHWPNDSAYSLLGNGDGTFSPTNVIFTPNPLAFGTVASGTKVETLTVTNLSSATKNVTFSGTPTITGTGAGQFSVLSYVSGAQSTCLQTSPTKLQLVPGSTCTFTIQFTSTGLGTSYNVTLNISDNGVGGSQLVGMTAKD